jgi:hypothetical protein
LLADSVSPDPFCAFEPWFSGIIVALGLGIGLEAFNLGEPWKLVDAR